MIYISVDNDYHTSLATLFIEQCNLKIENITLISQISLRNNNAALTPFKKLEISGHPLSAGSGYARPISYVRSIQHKHKLDRIFDFNYGDILIVITEYQLNNAILAKKMKIAGGQVYIFDEGISFYFNNSSYNQLHTKRKDKLYLSLYNLVFRLIGIPAQANKGYEGRMFLSIKDYYINCIYSSFNYPINRSIPVFGYRNFLCSAPSPKNLESQTAILFASNFTEFGLKKEEMDLVALTIDKMASNFSEVYIKIHPSDFIAQNDVYVFYTNLKYDNVKLIDNSMGAVESIYLHRPAIVVGSMSTVLFDAMLLGCQPIFLFHLLPSIPGFSVLKSSLADFNYHFITSLEEVLPTYECEVELANLVYTYDLSNHFPNDSNHDHSFTKPKLNL